MILDIFRVNMPLGSIECRYIYFNKRIDAIELRFQSNKHHNISCMQPTDISICFLYSFLMSIANLVMPTKYLYLAQKCLHFRLSFLWINTRFRAFTFRHSKFCFSFFYSVSNICIQISFEQKVFWNYMNWCESTSGVEHHLVATNQCLFI